MTDTQTAFSAIRIAIHNDIATAEARCRRVNPWCGLELLLTLDMIETYALKMMWTS